MKVFTLSKDIKTSSRLAKEKQGLNIMKHLCERKNSGKAYIKGDFFSADDIYIKSIAFLKGIVKTDGPIFADS